MKEILAKINWKVRFQDKTFVISLIGLIFLLIQQILAVFGVNWDYTLINEQITQVINTVFLILALIGVVKDPTTPGLKDSDQAMMYGKGDDK
ncbi:phage holin [Enterococcus sp. CSURQ0835]|uniref:phage holin n=1 Tax=Enterococcus sp. CSURQ0835 TaxID=2681394 RepID=UPI001F30CD27|nr:phage holin [Enterococcus sp. CSURQ0835]